MTDLNAAGIAVYQCSWIPDHWQWSVATPDAPPMFGGAATKEEAREQAHLWARLNGYVVSDA